MSTCLNAYGIVVGIVIGGALALYMFFDTHPHPIFRKQGVKVASVALVMIILTPLASIVANQITSAPLPVSTNYQQGIDITSTPILSPVPTATPIPTPTPTPLPGPGTVLCQPKASDWPQTNDWQTVGTEYVNKDGNTTPVFAPCNIPVSDYYVEAQIRTSQTSFGAFMGVLARLNLEKKVGYKGGIFYATFCGENCGDAELYNLLNSQSNTAKFGTFPPNTIATVKLQVKGTDVTIYVNDNLVVEEHYTSANDVGKVGLECDQACEVLQFTVVAQ